MKLQVLFVDDEPRVLAGLSAPLRRSGLDISNGNDGLGDTPPDSAR